MLNAEKYRDEILRIAMSDFAKKNSFSPCCYALVYVSKKTTTEESVKWLFSEYEPPLLENGDDLKPGDWIMVNNGLQSWYKKQFTYYYNGKFYCAQDEHDLEYGKSHGWYYARLPEEGE